MNQKREKKNVHSISWVAFVLLCWRIKVIKVPQIYCWLSIFESYLRIMDYEKLSHSTAKFSPSKLTWKFLPKFNQFKYINYKKYFFPFQSKYVQLLPIYYPFCIYTYTVQKFIWGENEPSDAMQSNRVYILNNTFMTLIILL